MFFLAASRDVPPLTTEEAVGINLVKPEIHINDDSVLQKDNLCISEFATNVPSFNVAEFSNNTQFTHNWANTAPLRETHISNKNTDIDNLWIDPLIEMGKQQAVISSSNEKSGKDDISEEDDFDEFQTAPVQVTLEWSKKILPETAINNVSTESHSQELAESKQPLDNYGSDINVTKSVFSDKSGSNLKHKNNLLSKKIFKQKASEDDEFTEFQSSVPVSLSNHISDSTVSNTTVNLRSISSVLPLEPLKPVPIYQTSNDLGAAQINWPDPGITEHEIKKFEDIFSTPTILTEKLTPQVEHKILKSEIKQDNSEVMWSDFTISKSSENPRKNEVSLTPAYSPVENMSKIVHNIPIKSRENSNKVWSDFITSKTENCGQTTQKSKSISSNRKPQSMEDDEWSDFVSAKKPSPVHKVVGREMERTSSPDLTLSVFNLSTIQPTKQPIPVITPQGLVQTKLSANTLNTSPKLQQKNTKQYFQSVQTVPIITPSIISNQYVSQAYNMNSVISGQRSTSDQGMCI